MEGENPEDRYGIDHVETPEDVMGVDLGNGLKSKIRSSEDNPKKPFEKGKAGGDGNILKAGEKNQQSDKDKNSKEGASWANRTGEKAKLATAAASGNIGKLAKAGNKKDLIMNTAKIVGPIGTILIVIAICIGGFLGSQSTMLGSLVGNLQGNFDPIDIAAAVRSKVLIKSIMSGKNTNGGLWSKFSDRMKARFKSANIEVDSDGDTESLVFKDADGDDVKVDAGNIDAELETNTDVHTQYFDGTATYSTSVPEYYDSDSENLKRFLGVDFNSLKDEEADGDYEKTKESFDEGSEEALEKASKGMDAEVEAGKEERTEPDVDEWGDPMPGTEHGTGEVDPERIGIDIGSEDAAEAAVEGMVRDSMEGSFDFNLVGQIAQGACQLYNTATTIHRMVKAYEAAQVVVMAARVLEAIQRMQAGDGGGDTLVDVVGNYLTHDVEDKIELTKGEEVTLKGSTMSSSPIAAVFGGSVLTDEDPIVKSFVTSPSQFMTIMASIDGAVGYEICVGMQLAAGIADAVIDGFTLGTDKIISVLVGIGASIAISAVVAAVVSVMVPKIVNALKRDFTTFLEGPQASGVLMWGSEQIMGENAKRTGMQPANPQTLVAYVKMKQEVIADRARYDRDNLSPFDTSSEYTFMGSLMRTLGKVSLKTDSVVGKIGSITSVVGKSLVSLTPAAHASGTVEEIISKGKCPEVSNINNDDKIASAFCTPHYISDYTTMGEGPENVMKYWDSRGAFDNYDPVNNPNPAIKSGNNDLALCIDEYVNRGAELGYPDSAIEQKYMKGSTGSTVGDAALGAVPIVGGLIDAFNNEEILRHLKNILGSKYTEDITENHMCERYILDQRMGETMGMYDKSQTAIYTEKYLKEHPLDNSPVGIIARRSGLTKDEVKKSIAMINGLLFVAKYNPEGLGPLVIEEKESGALIESTDNHAFIVGIWYSPTVSEEKRNQNTTA